MSGLKHAGSFRDLIVYQKSRQLQLEIFKVTKSFPRDEMFSLTDQIRQSFRSIGSINKRAAGLSKNVLKSDACWAE